MAKMNTLVETFLPDAVDGDSLTDAQRAELERLTKYESIATNRDTDMPPYFRIEEGSDIVAVHDKRSGFTGVVMRQMTAAVDLGDGRVARSYKIVAVQPTPSREAALAIVWAPQTAAAKNLLGSLVTADPAEEPF